jgi:mycothiol system anti-sigma-R factor
VSKSLDLCAVCEELMQPFLDRVLDAAERAQAEAHLELCGYCQRRYVFEERLRVFVRQACSEHIPPELKERLAALRSAG